MDGTCTVSYTHLDVYKRQSKGNEALLSYHHLPEDIKEICKEKLGNPEDVMVINLLEPYITFDKGASDFLSLIHI